MAYLTDCRLALFLLCLLTIADILLTHRGLYIGILSEANPVMHWLFARKPRLAVLLTTTYVCIACLIVNRFWHQVRWLPVVVWSILALKAGVMALHVHGLVRSGGGLEG